MIVAINSVCDMHSKKWNPSQFSCVTARLCRLRKLEQLDLRHHARRQMRPWAPITPDTLEPRIRRRMDHKLLPEDGQQRAHTVVRNEGA